MFDIEIDTSEIEEAWGRSMREMARGLTRGVERGVEAGAAEAKASHRYQDRTGKLTGSIRGYLELAAAPIGGGEAVGVLEARAKHASFLENGTAPHEIRPRNKKALHLEAGSAEEVFAARVQHPGTQPRPFMGPALQKAERVVEVEAELAAERVADIMGR